MGAVASPIEHEKELCEEFTPSDLGNGYPRTEHAAAPGEKVLVICQVGYAPEKDKVTCGPDAVLDPSPACVVVEDWCLARARGGPERPKHPAAALGGKVKVSCGEGFQAKDAEVTCGGRNDFNLKPECVQIEVKKA